MQVMKKNKSYFVILFETPVNHIKAHITWRTNRQTHTQMHPHTHPCRLVYFSPDGEIMTLIGVWDFWLAERQQ